MITNKRGISPLIATVLIVGFTIVLAVIVINFVLSTTESQTQSQSCQAQAEQACLSFAGPGKIGILAAATNTGVTITNLGAESANFTAQVYTPAGVTFATATAPTSKLGTGQQGSLTLTIAPSAGHTVRVTPIIQKTVNGLSCVATCTAASSDLVV